MAWSDKSHPHRLRCREEVTKFLVSLALPPYTWEEKTVVDTSRFMTLSFTGFARKLFLNPPLSGRQALAVRQGLHFAWRFYREGEIWIGTPPLGILPLSGLAGRVKSRYSLFDLAFSLRRLLGPQWRRETLFYLPSGAAL